MAVPDQPRIHPDSALLSRDGVGYRCRFEGAYPVPESRGVAMVTDACRRMRESKSRRSEDGLKRAPGVELRISVPGGLEVRTCCEDGDLTAQTCLLRSPLDGVAFAACDPGDGHYVGVVCATKEAGGFECYVFKQEAQMSRDLLITINQAFELGRLSAISNLQHQFESYKARLVQLSKEIPPTALQQYLKSQGIAHVLEILAPKPVSPAASGRKVQGQAPLKLGPAPIDFFTEFSI